MRDYICNNCKKEPLDCDCNKFSNERGHQDMHKLVKLYMSGEIDLACEKIIEMKIVIKFFIFLKDNSVFYFLKYEFDHDDLINSLETRIYDKIGDGK